MLLNIFTNFDKQKYYQNQPKFNGVYSRNDSAKIKDEAYVINLDEHKLFLSCLCIQPGRTFPLFHTSILIRNPF